MKLNRKQWNAQLAEERYDELVDRFLGIFEESGISHAQIANAFSESLYIVGTVDGREAA